MSNNKSWPIFLFESCSSTQDEAKKLGLRNKNSALADSKLPLIVVAKNQTAGRGRGNSKWEHVNSSLSLPIQGEDSDSGLPNELPNGLQNEPENRLKNEPEAGPQVLYDFPAVISTQCGDFSPVTFSFPAAAIAIPFSWVPMAVGCAVIDALNTTTSFLFSSFPELSFAAGDLRKQNSPAFHLKWPNDIVCCVEDRSHAPAWKKICGILCETSVQGGNFSNILVGLGLNFFRAPQLEHALSFFDCLFFRYVNQSDWETNLPNGVKSHVRKKSFSQEIGKFLRNKELRNAVLQRFCAELIKELEEYLFQKRSAGQLKGLGTERSLPVGTLLSVNKGTQVGKFLGYTLDGALLLDGGHAPILAADVAFYGSNSKETGAPKSNAKEKSNSESPPSTSERVENYILTLEAGNTRVHWAFFSPQVLSRKNLQEMSPSNGGHFTWESIRDGAKYFQENARTAPELRPMFAALAEAKRSGLTVAFSSVSTPENNVLAEREVTKMLHVLFPELKVNFHKFSSLEVLKDLKIGNQYVIETLGCDRALRFRYAANVAQKKQHHVGILCFGTAVTFEAVSPNGDIVESLIAPGWSLSLNALHEQTALLPDLEPRVLRQDVFSTEQAMQEGFYSPWISHAKNFLSQYEPALLYVSGGNSALFMDAFFRSVKLEGKDSEESFKLFLNENIERCALAFLAFQRSQQARQAFFLSSQVTCHEPESRLQVEKFHLEKAISQKAKGAEVNDEEVKGEGANGERINAEAAFEEDVLDNHVHSYGRAPPEAMMKSMLRARLIKSSDLRIEPQREFFRRLGPRVEHVKEQGERIDKWLADRFRFHNRETWKKRVETGEVMVMSNAPRETPFEAPDDGLRCIKYTYRVKNFDQLWLFHPPEYEPDIIDTCEIAFDDGDTVVFSKPGNLVVHAAGVYGKNTFLQVARKMGYADASPVHRLDRETSGALVCARTTETRRLLALAFRNSMMKKMYLAVTKNSHSLASPELPDIFNVAHTIGPAQGSLIRLKLWIDNPAGQDAQTGFVKLASWESFNLFACFPITGRTNQIRIHLAAIGQWIVGDKMYHPNEEVFLTFYEKGLTPWVYEQVLFPRHLLHNAAIEAIGTGDERVATPSGGIWKQPALAIFPDDMLHFHPLLKLMETAGMPVSALEQREWLGKLFEKYEHSHFENEQCFR